MRTKGWGVRAFVAVVGVAVLAPGCILDGGFTGGGGPRVSLIGADVLDEAGSVLRDELDPDHLVRITSIDGASIQNMQALATEHGSEYPDVVVLELGTQDARTAAPVADALAQLDTMVGKFPASCIVAVNVNTQIAADGFDVAEAQAINGALAAHAEEVVDWDAIVAADPAGRTVAPLHLVPTPAGVDLLRAAVSTAVDACFTAGRPITPDALAPLGSTSTARPTFSARYDDPDGQNGHTEFMVWHEDTGALVTSGAGSTVAPGQRSVWQPPLSALSLGGTYLWGAANVDVGGARSNASAVESLQVLPGRPPVFDSDFPDPFVLSLDDRYLAYSTGTNLAPGGPYNVPVLESWGLGPNTWIEPGTVGPPPPGDGPRGEAMPVANMGTWTEARRKFDLNGEVDIGGTWAPTVQRRDGVDGTFYVLYYTARRSTLDHPGMACIGRATATAPEGPFVDTSGAPFHCDFGLGGSIDADVYIDPGGTEWLLWKSDTNSVGGTSRLWAATLSTDGLSLGTPIPLLERDQNWERHPDGNAFLTLIEQPAIVDVPGHRWLFYSGSAWDTSSYAEGFAECPTTFTPSSTPICTKVTSDATGPWLASEPRTGPARYTTSRGQGPGAAAFFRGGASGWWFGHHAWTGAVGYQQGGRRALFIDKLTATPDGPGIDSSYPYELHRIGDGISNGRVILGVKPSGALITGYTGGSTGCLDPCAADAPLRTRNSNGSPRHDGLMLVPGDAIGLRLIDPNDPESIDDDALTPGCSCEGWGVGDTNSGVWGGDYSAVGEQNLTHLEAQSDGWSYLSRVGIGEELPGEGNPLEVRHDFQPARDSAGNLVAELYEITVTVTNHQDTPADLRYRRVMDWDVPPEPFNEYVTIAGTRPTSLEFTSNNGFDAVNPLASPNQVGGDVPTVDFDANFGDLGPGDHGAMFQFDLGEVAPGASTSFRIYYGGGDDEAGAEASIARVGAPVYSLGQPEVGPLTGAPNTYIFAYKPD